MKKPTGYQMMQGALFLSGASTASLVYLLTEWTPSDVLRSIALVLCGMNFSGIFYNWLVKESVRRDRRLRAAYDELHIAFEKMGEVNRALVENKIKVRVLNLRLADEGDKPSVH